MSVTLLMDKIEQTGNPTVAGLDPRLSMLPEELLTRAIAAHGETLKAAAEAVWVFNKGILEALAGVVPAVKLQSACYEAFGPEGFALMRDTIRLAREAGFYVIADAKRGDIGSTAQDYSAAFLGKIRVGGTDIAPMDADALTVNPYLGSDCINPFLEDCKAYNRMIFVLGRTSNPSSRELQELDVGGAPLYERVGALIKGWGEGLMAPCGYSSVGLVAGATHPEQAKALRDKLPGVFFLVPGYGAQGAGASDAAAAFDAQGRGAIVNSSRAILCAWQKNGGSFADAARAEALDMRAKLREALGK